LLVSVVASLLAIGLVVLYSATAIRCDQLKGGDALFFFRKQLLWTALSAGALLLAMRIPISWWSRSKIPLLALTVALLALVLIPGVGTAKKGASRWFEVAGWSLQPSELAKLTVIAFLCAFASEAPDRLRSFFRGFLPCFGALAVVCGLIARQPDAGTAAFLGGVGAMTLFVAGIRLRHLVPALLAGGAVGGWFVYSHFGHVRDRLQVWLHPESAPIDKAHQLKQSLIALGAGGWWGKGLGAGTQKLYYLPEVHADFLFPILGEELGFVGTIGVLLLYLTLGAVGWKIARRSSTPFGFLFALGISGLILFQAAMNIAVVTGMVPTKGIPLPFLSSGGSALLFAMIGIGILLRIDREGERCAGSSWPEGAPEAISTPALR